jgi:Phosphatidyl serine synthase
VACSKVARHKTARVATLKRSLGLVPRVPSLCMCVIQSSACGCCAGICIGMWTVRKLGSREYNWSGLSSQPTLRDMAKRSLLQFTPHSFDRFDWRIFSSPARCLQSIMPVAVFLLFEVNAFFLKVRSFWCGWGRGSRTLLVSVFSKWSLFRLLRWSLSFVLRVKFDDLSFSTSKRLWSLFFTPFSWTM